MNCGQCKQPVPWDVRPAQLFTHDGGGFAYFCTVACLRDWVVNAALVIGEGASFVGPLGDSIAKTLATLPREWGDQDANARELCYRILRALEVNDMGGCPLCCS